LICQIQWYVVALNGKFQALAAFEDAADIGATAQYLGHHEEAHRLQMKIANDVLSVISVLRPKNRFVPQNDPHLFLVALLSSSTSRFDVTWDIYHPDDKLKAQIQAKRCTLS